MKTLAAILLFCATSSLFAQDVLIAVKKDGKWGYVNTTGTYVIPARFDEAYPFNNGRAVAVEKKLYGLLDSKGKWIVGPRKGEVMGETGSSRLVCSDDLGKWGAIDMKGTVVIPFEKDLMSTFRSGLALVGTKTTNPELVRIAVVDTLGKMVVNFDNTYLPASLLREARKIREGHLTVLVDGPFEKTLNASPYKLDDKPLYYALLDSRAKRLVSLKLASLDEEVREGRFNTAIDGIAYSWSQPLAAEPVVSEAKFSYLSPVIFPFSGGIATVQKDGKWAFVDKDGSLLSESKLPVEDYQSEMPMYIGGFVIFRKKSGEGIYVDLRGNQKIPLEFEELTPFQSGAAVVKYKGKYGLIQKDGTWALPAEYDAIRWSVW